MIVEILLLKLRTVNYIIESSNRVKMETNSSRILRVVYLSNLKPQIMNNVKDKRSADRSRVSVSEDWKVKWWSDSLGISAEQFKHMMNKVSNSNDKVKDIIQQNFKKS